MIFDPCPDKNENPLDQLDPTGGFTAIFRTIACIGDSLSSAFIHTARTQTRTVERRLWTLQREHAVESSILIFFNRLSDYLFALANAKR